MAAGTSRLAAVLSSAVLLAYAVPSPSAAAPSPPPPLRFPQEGGAAATVCGVSSGDGPELLRAKVAEVSSTLNIPGREWYGPSKWVNDTVLGPWRGGILQTVALPTPTRVNSSCVTVFGGTTDAAGPGMLYVSSDNGTTWGNGTRAEWYESVAVAFGLRPYITGQETEATLLVWADPSVGSIASVEMELPFASPARTQKWGAAGPRAELRFAFTDLPESINQDVKIVIKLSSGHRFSKLRRLMRAPALPATSTALPVQVDHVTRGLRVDGRPYTGVGWYLDGLSGSVTGAGFASFPNMTEYLTHAQAPLGVNQGMIYRLFTYPPEHQLVVLDQLAQSGFKVMYEVGQQLDDCGDPIQAELLGKPGLCFNESTQLSWLRDVVHLVRHHPAILGYYICDDCCKSDTGASFQAQAYNFIKREDPYHIVIGASDCADNYIFSDVPSSPVQPTADLSDAMIKFGQQPHTQLSLDYVMIENYGGGLSGHRNGGTWSTGVGNDGRLRNGIPFEPLCNCPGFGASWQTVTDAGAGETILMSEMWEGVVNAGMYDQLNFIEGGDARGDAVMADFARQLAEVVPSVRASAGVALGLSKLSVRLRALNMDGSSMDESMPSSAASLIAAVWEETPAAPAVFCAHMAVINSNITAYSSFEFILEGRAPPAGQRVTARRIFSPGLTVNISTGAGSAAPAWEAARDFIAPGLTNLYRIGCETATPDPDNLAANPTMEAPALSRMPGWSQAAYGDAEPLVTMTSDTSVAAEGRHSVRINCPTSKPIVFPLSGTQLVKPASDTSWGSKHVPPAGTRVFSSSVVLAPGKSYEVRLAVQASPPGTTVEILDGYWAVRPGNGSAIKEASPLLLADYHGSSIASIAAGQEWKHLEAVVHVPAATTHHNGTALQLRVSPRAGQKFGATVWADDVTIKEKEAAATA